MMNKTYLDIVGDYYDGQDQISDLGGENELRIYDQGNWVSIHTFLKERSQ